MLAVICMHKVSLAADDHCIDHGNQYLKEVIYSPLKKYGNSRKNVVTALGNPMWEQKIDVKNKYDPKETDYIHTLVYLGKELSIYRTYFNKEILASVEIVKSHPDLTKNINHGDTPYRVKEVLPHPNKEDNNTYKYLFECMDGTDVLAIHFQSNKVSKIIWSYSIE